MRLETFKREFEQRRSLDKKLDKNFNYRCLDKKFKTSNNKIE